LPASARPTVCPAAHRHSWLKLLCRRLERQVVELKQELAMKDTLSGKGRVSYSEAA
jgi:hypothetical protein